MWFNTPFTASLFCFLVWSTYCRKPHPSVAAPLATASTALFANSFGWIFTEMGRQPWVVFGLMTTERGVSPGVSPAEALTSLLVLTALYGVLAVVELKLLLHYIVRGADAFEAPTQRDDDQDPDRPLAFAY